MADAIVKNLTFGNEARDNVFKGITKLTKAVSSTLGAGGKCVMLEDGGGNPLITKDGVTVADSIILLDPVENMGATLLKEAARKTVKEAGDGTTTATVLAYAILEEAYSLKDSVSQRELKEGIETAVNKVVKILEKGSVKAEGDMLKQIATISTNNDPALGTIIAEAFEAVGEQGVVMMETTEDPETVTEIVDGVQYAKGLTNSNFVTNQHKRESELINPKVLLIESPVENIRQIQTVLEYILKTKKSLLIIADLDPKVLAALAMNRMKGNIKVNVINAPTYGVGKKEVLTDLAMLTGATIINEDLGDDLELIQPEHLGSCAKSVTTDEDTIIQVEDVSKEVLEAIENVRKELKEKNTPYKVIQLEKRLARLSAKVAIVKVGANSAIELKEKADRVEDAICATKAALKEGIVAGGGVALLNASRNIKPTNEGEKILLEAIRAPYLTVLKNAGIEYGGDLKDGYGIDVVTGETVSMVKEGIIDPLLVTKSALRNAASVAATILSTDCVINNLRVNEGNR